MNLLDQIKRDHDNLRQMLEKLEATTERAIKTRRTQFERVRQELTVHAHVEEAVLQDGDVLNIGDSYLVVRYEPASLEDAAVPGLADGAEAAAARRAAIRRRCCSRSTARCRCTRRPTG